VERSGAAVHAFGAEQGSLGKDSGYVRGDGSGTGAVLRDGVREADDAVATWPQIDPDVEGIVSR
jgi:hypothetical protein